MRQRKIALVMAVVALAILVVPSAFASSAPPPMCEYTPGYWKRAVTEYQTFQGDYPADNSGVKESDYSMECYEGWIGDNCMKYFDINWAYEEFWMRGPDRQPVRQMIADWFNMAKAAMPM